MNDISTNRNTLYIVCTGRSKSKWILFNATNVKELPLLPPPSAFNIYGQSPAHCVYLPSYGVMHRYICIIISSWKAHVQDVYVPNRPINKAKSWRLAYFTYLMYNPTLASKLYFWVYKDTKFHLLPLQTVYFDSKPTIAVWEGGSLKKKSFYLHFKE